VKKLLMIFTYLFLVTAYSQPENQLPEAQVDVSTLGGHIILIEMKEYLIISGDETKALESELGETVLKNFFQDMLLSTPTAELIEKYIQRSSSQLISQKIISRYADILLKINKFKVLN
jgi:hypothetical protein